MYIIPNKMLSVIEFGTQLIETLDLDPIYVMLHAAQLPPAKLNRWCAAYWMYYHAGVSSELSEYDCNFWEMVGFGLEKWPRGTERRHFRGPAAHEAVMFLAARYPTASSFVKHLAEQKTYTRISYCAMQHPQFGPWIAFKIADMLDRVLCRPIDFSDCDLHFYREPEAGLELAMKELNQPDTESTLHYLVERFSKFKAPPRFDRPVDIPEVETILCKWKAYRHRHYYIGKDTLEIAHALESFPCKTSKLLLKHLKANCKCRTAMPRLV